MGASPPAGRGLLGVDVPPLPLPPGSLSLSVSGGLANLSPPTHLLQGEGEREESHQPPRQGAEDRRARGPVDLSNIPSWGWRHTVHGKVGLVFGKPVVLHPEFLTGR